MMPFGRGANNFSSSIATCLQSARHFMPCYHNSSLIPIMEVDAIIEALRKHLQGNHSDYDCHAPRAALSAGIVSCFKFTIIG